MNFKKWVFFGFDESENFCFKLNYGFNFSKLLTNIIPLFYKIMKKEF